MPTYRYKVRDRYGRAVTGTIDGEDRDVAARILETQGYSPVSIKEKGRLDGLEILSRFRRVSPEEINFFTRQLKTMSTAGLPLTLSLSALREQVKNKDFSGIIADLLRDLESGSSFSGALSRHPRVFSELYVAMVRSGEAAGILDEVLERLAELGEYEADVRSRIKAATRYPVITFAALCLGVLIVVTFVLPRFAQLFAELEVPLPLPTLILIWINHFVQGYWFLLLAGAAAVIFTFLRLIRTNAGRARWDSFKLRVPVFGPLVLKLLMERFARVTGMLVRSGLPILQVLEMTSRTTGNVVISRAIENIRVGVNQGKGMSEPMRASGVFSPVVVQMVAVGEETGKVDELLFHVSKHYEQEVSYAIKNLTTMIEPIFIVFLASGVLLMALAVLLPMWNLIALIKR